MQAAPCAVWLAAFVACSVGLGPVGLSGCSDAPRAAEISIETSPSDAVFPAVWRKAPILATGRELPPEALERGRAAVKRALAKYPPEIVRENLRNVWLLRDLQYYGIFAAGTNSATQVYINIGEEAAGYTPAFIEGVFHAEFSSILLRNKPHALDREAWREANPPGFEYTGSGVGAIRAGQAGQTPRDELMADGFFGEYTRSNLENDFNRYSLMLFRGEVLLWEAAARYPRIQRKLELTLAFYESLSPELTRKRFRSFAEHQ
ncbi:MAG: hypothetical protein SFZ23_12435 [Planctomycetota bacterium]|nr:hypothetical protein [Planctomycetota bacterium]